MPENITGGALSQGEYERYAREAVIHVVAAVKDAPRSTGQAAYLDALMLGRPVVVTDGLGVRDHLRDGIDAVIVQPDDPPALASAINRLLRSEGLRRQIGSEGARRARELFTMEAFRARQYAQLLEIWNLRRAARDGERSGTLQT
jgi:glycosyltransferase involved in cell wall biosynthesis